MLSEGPDIVHKSLRSTLQGDDRFMRIYWGKKREGKHIQKEVLVHGLRCRLGKEVFLLH